MLLLISMLMSFVIIRAWEEASGQARTELGSARDRINAHIENQRVKARERLSRMRAKGPRTGAWWGWLGITSTRVAGSTGWKAAKGTAKGSVAAGRVARAGVRGARQGYRDWRDYRRGDGKYAPTDPDPDDERTEDGEPHQPEGGGEQPQQDNTDPGEGLTTCPYCGTEIRRKMLMEGMEGADGATRCIYCLPVPGEANCPTCRRRCPIDDLTGRHCPACRPDAGHSPTADATPDIVDAEIIYDPEDPSTWGRISRGDPAQPGLPAGQPQPDTKEGHTAMATDAQPSETALAQNEGGEMGIEDTRLIYDQISDQMTKVGDLVQRLSTSLSHYEASQDDIKDASNVMEAASILATAAQTARANHDTRNQMTEQAAVEETQAVRNTDYHRRGK